MKNLTLLTFCILIQTLAGCAGTGKVPATPHIGFLEGYYDKLAPAPETAVTKQRWIKPGVDLTRYKKVMVDYVVFSLDESSKYKAISGDEMKELGDAASLALVNAIKKSRPVVAEPGPDVCRLRMAIVGLKQSNPVLSGITTVIPVGLGTSIIKKGVTGAWSGSGATRAEAMILDSETSEVIAAGCMEHTAGFTERFTPWGSVAQAFEYWGEQGAKAIEAMAGIKKQGTYEDTTGR